MDVHKLNNVAIVSVEGAARLGRVSDVLFETDPLRVAALKATGDEGEFIVPIDLVRKFGSDAVMVEKPDVRQLVHSGGTGMHSLSELKKLKVVDEDGTYLGTVNAIDFDADTGHVERLTAGTGGVLGVGGSSATIAAQAVRSVGSELLTVASSDEPSAVEEERAESAPETSDTAR